ncbi:MAG: homoserine dehydrogenase, partial [Actinomycetales bacterium]|nr:homoserine dehydrogenase [Actinomycetales bacterium]
MRRVSVRVALIGCGTVGTEVARLLLTSADDLAARVGAPVELVGIAERSTETERDPVIPRDLLTTDWRGLVARADVVIELIGGVEPARTMILEAMAGG